MAGNDCRAIRRSIWQILSPRQRGSNAMGETGTPPSLRPAKNAGRSFRWGYNLSALRALRDKSLARKASTYGNRIYPRHRSRASISEFERTPLDKYRYNDYYVSMPGQTRKRTGRERPLRTLEEEVFLQLQRTADMLLQRLEGTLKTAGLSPTQYNVLRILRGAGAQGLACQRIAERMVTRDPDVTRLLDRLEVRGWVTRIREKRDRRVITVRITRAGSDLLRTLDKPVVRMHGRQLGHVSERKLRSLIKLLEQVRGSQ
ncbi:MAG: MarR family winged helix-turn-helix transcriptional regulator [Terriglobia bacterium]